MTTPETRKQLREIEEEMSGVFEKALDAAHKIRILVGWTSRKELLKRDDDEAASLLHQATQLSLLQCKLVELELERMRIAREALP